MRSDVASRNLPASKESSPRVDLVAEGMPLRLRQEDVVLSGHAVECRINAEDWADGFRPSPGRIERVVLPVGDGIRVDTHVQGGSVVPPYHDSLLAKLIVHGPTAARPSPARGPRSTCCGSRA